MLAAFFVIHPSNLTEVSSLQTEMKDRFAIALEQSLGDASFFEPFEQTISGIQSFFNESTNTAIALISQPDTDADLAFVFSKAYSDVSAAFGVKTGIFEVSKVSLDIPFHRPANFMSEDPLFNILPANPAKNQVAKSLVQPIVAGNFMMNFQPANKEGQWVTLQDNFTDQIYCVAIYNGEVNKYLGPCKYDYR